MSREEAIDIIRKNIPHLGIGATEMTDALNELIPELRESEDERIRKFLLDYAIEMIAGLESDISLSTYDGIKGHDPDAEAELNQWQKARAYLEKQEQKPTDLPAGFYYIDQDGNKYYSKEFRYGDMKMKIVEDSAHCGPGVTVSGEMPADWTDRDKRILDDVSNLLIMLNYKDMARDYKQAIEKLIKLK